MAMLKYVKYRSYKSYKIKSIKWKCSNLSFPNLTCSLSKTFILQCAESSKD